jgi:hypothetical protein
MAAQKSGAEKATRARGSGIPASGAGWGGPAKGASTSAHPDKNRPPKPIEPGPGRGKFKYSLQGETRLERESRQAEEARAFYYEIMHKATEPTPNRLAAATKLLERIEGLPVQKIVQAQQDSLDRMTHEQKLAERDALAAKIAARGK